MAARAPGLRTVGPILFTEHYRQTSKAMPTAMFYGADSRPFIRHVGELSEDLLRERVATLKQLR